MSRVLKYYQTQVDDSNKVTIGRAPDPGANAPSEAKAEREAAREDLSKVEKMFEKAKEGADVILSTASANAAALLEEARIQAEEDAKQIAQEAKDRGYAKGLKAGEEEGERLKAEAEEVLEEAHRRREEIIANVEGEVVELIAKLIDKLLANTIEINPDIVAKLVRGQLTNMHSTGDVTIRVSPDDYEDVLKHKDEIASAVDASVNIEIAKDVTFKKAECILETPLGSVDISIESSYRMLKENLTYLFKMGELHADH